MPAPVEAEVAASSKSESTQPAESAQNGSAAAAQGEKKLSGAELKKLKQAEKQARRAQAKEATGAPATSTTKGPSESSVAAKSKQPSQQQAKSQKQQQTSKAKESSSNQQSSASANKSASQEMPIRSKQRGTVASTVPDTNKNVVLFNHLYSTSRRLGLAGAPKEVHPAVAALGLQMSSYDICGSTARCVAMMVAFKSVIASYSTPQGTSLARHLIPHSLSPQIEFLRSCRPISVSMGNAIRFLKQLISEIDPSVPDSEAKDLLLASIDTYLRERITAADGVIAETAAQKISNGDVILTYAKSSLVLNTLLVAKAAGKDFSVICIDSKPLFEGKRLALDLAHAGIPVSYALISATSHFIGKASKVFVGAHAMMANGRLYSRVGTAIVAMLANDFDVPLIVLSESVKFTDKVALDSIVGNEVGPAEELLLPQADSKGINEPQTAWAVRDTMVDKWQTQPNLQLLNILYDVTPAEYIQMIITEYGTVPPSSVPAVLRMLESAKGQG